MAKGFLSFVLGAVFLLALVSAGLLISASSPDYSYEGYRTALVSEVAIKNAYYQAVSQAASSALNASLAASAAGAQNDPRAAIRAGVLAQTMSFESQLGQHGYDVAFWCGPAPEQARQQANRDMASQKKAVAPQGTRPAGACAESFEANLLSKKVHLYDMGFSIYHSESGIGQAAVFPPSYEVPFQ